MSHNENTVFETFVNVTEAYQHAKAAFMQIPIAMETMCIAAVLDEYNYGAGITMTSDDESKFHYFKLSNSTPAIPITLDTADTISRGLSGWDSDCAEALEEINEVMADSSKISLRDAFTVGGHFFVDHMEAMHKVRNAMLKIVYKCPNSSKLVMKLATHDYVTVQELLELLK